MNPLASEKEVGIKVEKLPSQNLSVWAHHDYLLQVFQNLISNGIKYNKPQGSLTLSVELLPDKRVKVRIADTGIGIPESKIERLFSPFDRLDAEREQSHIEGSGLGLTLTKSLIKAMKGTISVVSKEGQGTEFSIELVGVS
jgi:signal transduction histidine kinase